MTTYANAREFVQAVVRRYRELSAYSDTGKSHRPHCLRAGLCQFETDYRAPGDFRFAFSRPHPFARLSDHWTHHVVGLSGSRPYAFRQTYDGAKSVNSPEDLATTVAGATGISSGTARTIAALLFDEVGGFSLLDLQRLRFRRSRVIDGVRCTTVTGLHPRAGRYTAWFGTEDLLLRRLVRTKLRTEETRTNIRVEHELPEARFAVPDVEG